MKKLLLIVVVFVLGYGYGRWYAKGPVPVTASAKFPARKILYYRDPMDPAYKSDKPGKSPKCGMDLEPVYEDSEKPTQQPPASSIFISPEKQQLIGVRYWCRGIRFRLRDSTRASQG